MMNTIISVGQLNMKLNFYRTKRTRDPLLCFCDTKNVRNRFRVKSAFAETCKYCHVKDFYKLRKSIILDSN